ncbi:MAG: AsmA family protein [Woeseia sp.]
MNRLLKTLMFAVAGVVVLLVVAAVALMLLFDPNDFRDRISAEVQKATGRELVIEGDLSASLFPWLAVEMGRARLGNAAGFGETPFVSFEAARLSVRLLPLLLKREVAIGTAQLDGLRLELAVNARGVSNWDDLANGGEATADEKGDGSSGPADLDISGIEILNSYIHYNDAQAKSDYTLQNVTLNTGRIALGEAFEFSTTADFASKFDKIDGQLKAAGNATIAEDFATATFKNLNLSGTADGIATRATEFVLAADELVANLANSTLQPAMLNIRVLGVDAELDIKSASWADAVVGEASLNVEAFSPRELAPLFDIELPPTADPDVLSRTQLVAQAAMTADAIVLRNLQLTLDDTSMTGEITIPLGDTGPYRFDLAGDSMNLDRYMAPASQGAGASGSAADDDFEIPVEMIRSTNARGKLQLQEAEFAGMKFTNIQLGLTSGGGKLRLSPLSAELFDGTYTGDVQVDASGATPMLSMNEKVADVNLSPLGKAMFERDQLSGTIDGNFVLKASGATLSAMRRNLNGTMAFELADGAWQGVDLWYQLRAARALYRREAPPEKREPVRTDFSSVIASGIVTNGVFTNNDLRADMPFLQLTGQGTVDFVSAEMDYALRARVLERPEFLSGASEEELAEFTEALIPVRIRGPISDPSIRPDIEAMFRDEVEGKLKEKGDELKKRLLDRLAPTAPAADPAAAGEEAAPGEEVPAEEELSPEEQLKKKLLKKLFD